MRQLTLRLSRSRAGLATGSLGPEFLYEALARIQVCLDLAVTKGQRAPMYELTRNCTWLQQNPRWARRALPRTFVQPYGGTSCPDLTQQLNECHEFISSCIRCSSAHVDIGNVMNADPAVWGNRLSRIDTRDVMNSHPTA